jgi:hypothetical protein
MAVMATRSCLSCGNSFSLKHPSQKFCPKNKAGRHLCKDQFHNKRRFATGDITPARRRFMAETAKPKQVSVLGLIDRKLGATLLMVPSDDYDGPFDDVHPFCSEAFEP